MSTTGHPSADPWSSFDYKSTRPSKMDSELASIVSSLSALSNPSAQHGQPHQLSQAQGHQGQLGGFRRPSINSNNGSDVESEILFQNQTSPVLRRTTLSVGGASVGAPNGVNNRLNLLGHYSASITGGHPVTNQQQLQQGGFFEIFGRTLVEGTREVELNLGTTSGRASRRESVNAMDSLARATTNATIQGSEVSVPRERRVSISSDALESVSENLNMQDNKNAARRNIWNVANAPVFKPQGADEEQPQNPEIFNSMYTFPYGPFQQFGGPLFAPMMSPPVPSPHPTIHTPAVQDGGELDDTDDIGKNDAQRQHQQQQQQMPPQFVFPGNPYVFFPSGATPPPHPVPAPPQSASPVSTIESQQNTSNNSNGSHANVRTHGNPYLHHPRGSRLNNTGPPQFKPSTPQQQAAPSQQNNKPKGKNNVPRSALLEEFRNNPTNKTYRLSDIYGSALEFCKDQHGSRFIQQELVNASDAEKEVIFNEIRDEAIALADDVFGNYVIQKFFEHGTKTQKDVLVEQFTGKMEQLSLEMYACRVIQRAFECIEEQQKVALVQELSHCVLHMIKDQNGNHVIQKAIERIPIDKLPFILGSLNEQIYHLSTHSYGCRVIQRLLEYGSLKDQDQILDELDQFIPYLIQDQYGNYVIQHILQHGGEHTNIHIGSTKQNIVDIVSKSVVEYSKHKFASNVVEKTMLFGSDSQKRQIMDRILPKSLDHAAHLEDNAPLILMMRDQYANYVVQKLVGVAQGEDKKLIVVAIRSYLDRLNKVNALGNRHLASVEKLAALVEKVEI